MNESPEFSAWPAELEHPLKHVAVLCHRGAEIPDDHPLLEVEGRSQELTAVVRARCDEKEKA